MPSFLHSLLYYIFIRKSDKLITVKHRHCSNMGITILPSTYSSGRNGAAGCSTNDRSRAHRSGPNRFTKRKTSWCQRLINGLGDAISFQGWREDNTEETHRKLNREDRIAVTGFLKCEVDRASDIEWCFHAKRSRWLSSGGGASSCWCC